MTKYFLILLTLCIGTPSKAQFSDEEEQYIDSLQSVIAKKKSDADVATAYINLSEILFYVYPDTLKPMCQKALELADKNLAKKNLSKEKIALFNRVKGNAYNNIGYVYDVQGELYEALDYYFRSLKIREKIKDSVGISTTLNNIGMVYDLQGNKEEAIKIYQRSIAIQRAINDTEGLAYSYMNMGVIYSDLQDYKQCRSYYDSSVYMHQLANDPRGLGAAYVGLGGVNYFLGNFNESIEAYTNALSIFDTYANQQGRTECYYGLGELYLNQEKLNLASEYGKKSYDLASELGHPFLLQNASRLLMEVYRKQGNYSKAFEMYDIYVQMKDSVRNESNEQMIVRKELNYQHEKQQFADSLRNAKILAISEMEVEKGKVELANKKMQNYLLYGGLVVVGLFLFFFINRFKISQRQKEQIQKQKKLVEQQRDEVSRQKEIIETAHKEITDSIAYAKRIQSAILPPSKLVKEYLNQSFILYKPKDIVAGDFYWLEHADNKVLFAACDCTGHGVPGAMVSVVCNNGLNRSVREHNLTDPGKILDKTREIVMGEFEKAEEDVKDGMDIALCSLEGNKLHYAGAHNPLWIVRNGSDSIEEIKANRQPIGKYHDPEPYTTHSVELNQGDTFYLFSDGFIDQFGGPEGKKFKAVNFRKLIVSIQSEPMEKQRQLIDEAFESWKGELEQLDDVCVIGVRV